MQVTVYPYDRAVAWRRHCYRRSVSYAGRICDRCKHSAACQPPVRFGGSSLVYDATASVSQHHATGNCRAVELHYVKTVDIFKIGHSKATSAAHISHMTPSVQL